VALKANTLLQKVPGLSGFLEKQADTIWQEGVDAVFEGDLYLGIFTSEELEAGLDILETARQGDVTQEADAQDPTTIEITEEQGKALVSRIDDYLTELFTPVRLDQLRTRLNSILDSSDYERRWIAFIVLLVEYMADEDAVENEKGGCVGLLEIGVKWSIVDLEVAQPLWGGGLKSDRSWAGVHRAGREPLPVVHIGVAPHDAPGDQ